MFRIKTGTSYTRQKIITSVLKYENDTEKGRQYFINLIKNGFIEMSMPNPLGVKNFHYYTIVKPFPKIWNAKIG